MGILDKNKKQSGQIKNKGMLSAGYSFVTLAATYAVGYVLLKLFPDGKTVGATVLFILINLIPMITACIFSVMTRECASIWDFLRKIFFRKENVVAYFMAISIPVVYYGLSAVLHNIRYTNAGIKALFAYFPWTLPQGGLEEVGWRWYLQKHIPIKGFIPKMLIISVVWFAWHIPIYALPWVTAASSDYMVFFLLIIGNTFTLGALGEKTNGAVPCILAHMLIDSCAVLMLVQSNLLCIVILVIFEVTMSVIANKFIRVKQGGTVNI